MNDREERSPSSPGKWRSLIERLESLGFRPSRSRGQNFLFDDALLRAIVADAQLDAHCSVLEVGTGCGILTEHLAPVCGRLLAVELDDRLAELTRERTRAWTNVEVLHADALDGKHALDPRVVAWSRAQARWRLVANLPYSVGTPILVACSRLEHAPEAMTVLLQEELVERIAASPGAPAWGAVSAKLQLLYDVRCVRRVGSQVFWPRPNVDSAVARLVRRQQVPPASAVARFDELATHLFAQRRKTLRSRLVSLVEDRVVAGQLCDAAAVDGDLRPERLSIEQLAALAAALERRRRESPELGSPADPA